MAADSLLRGHRIFAAGLVDYDAERKRVWVGGQRLHHGMTGAVLAALGSVLMAHDWHDRSVWFQKGRQAPD